MIKYYKTVNINTATKRARHGSVLIIYTGGTIGMDKDKDATSESLTPFDFEKIIEKVPELKRFDFELTVLSFFELLDSSDISVQHWLELARIIHDFYDDYDGFVILHGTDTMAYTASALSYLLRNLGKPVILTGAQLPIGASRTDARENLISTLEIASSKKNGVALIPEVCIYFDHVLLRGNRAKKVQNFKFTAFQSSNYPPLAVAGIHIDYNLPAILPHQEEPFSIYKKMNSHVTILKLFPGISREYIETVLAQKGLRGIVLETYGSGNAPTAHWFLELLEKAMARDIVIFNVSQCNGGSVVQGKYITSKHLQDIGVVGGSDITTEAAITKMMLLTAYHAQPETVKSLLVSPLAGELT